MSPQTRERLEREARLEYDSYEGAAFIKGAEALERMLLEKAPEFDEKASIDRACEGRYLHDRDRVLLEAHAGRLTIDRLSYVNGERSMHAQLSASLAARDERIAELGRILEQMNRDCISRFLHEQRMGEFERQLAEAHKCLGNETYHLELNSAVQAVRHLRGALKDAHDTIHGEFCGDLHHKLRERPAKALAATAQYEEGKSGV